MFYRSPKQFLTTFIMIYTLFVLVFRLFIALSDLVSVLLYF